MPVTTSYADPSGGLLGGEPPGRPVLATSAPVAAAWRSVLRAHLRRAAYFPLPRYGNGLARRTVQVVLPGGEDHRCSHGSKIDYAVGPGGTRYTDLDNAFAHRANAVDNCTCNGKDALGLARERRGR